MAANGIDMAYDPWYDEDLWYFPPTEEEEGDYGDYYYGDYDYDYDYDNGYYDYDSGYYDYGNGYYDDEFLMLPSSYHPPSATPTSPKSAASSPKSPS